MVRKEEDKVSSMYLDFSAWVARAQFLVLGLEVHSAQVHKKMKKEEWILGPEVHSTQQYIKTKRGEENKKKKERKREKEKERKEREEKKKYKRKKCKRKREEFAFLSFIDF